MTQTRLDPVTREVIRNALSGIADSMAVTVVRTARSSVVRDGMDFSTAVFNSEGEQVAQGVTLPVHLGAMMPALEAIMDAFEEDIRPGDVFINNDPYEGGSHLPDIFLYKPVFAHGVRVAWTGVIAHQTDIGGRVAGGNACDSTEIYQEGLRIPPIKFFEEGKVNPAVWRILEKNVRVPNMVMGDVRAQIAAATVAEREFLHLVDEHGLEEMQGYMADILDSTERLTRAELTRLPQGQWEFTDYIDDDGIGPDPIRIHVQVRIDGTDAYLDFTGTSPQAKGAINPNLAFTKSIAYASFKCVLSQDVPANAGFFRPFHVTAPEGSFVNPQHPAPVAARALGGFRTGHAILGALAQALPDLVPAAWGGGEVGISYAGYRRDRTPFLYMEFNNDGPRGGGPDADGIDGASSPVINQVNVPVEVVEANHDLLIERYGFVPDACGPGQYRGGMAIVRDLRVLAEEATVQVRSDRRKFLPYGLQGGKSGTPCTMTVNPGTGEEEVMPSKFLRTFRRGELLHIQLAGGGGWGDPLQRDPEAVLEDVRQEKHSVDYARTGYGVIIDAEKLEVDLPATEELRVQMRSERNT